LKNSKIFKISKSGNPGYIISHKILQNFFSGFFKNFIFCRILHIYKHHILHTSVQFPDVSHPTVLTVWKALGSAELFLWIQSHQAWLDLPTE